MQNDDKKLVINLAEQRLSLFDRETAVFTCAVSTALNGPGERFNSGCTPRGRHKIRIKIGQGCPVNTVFAGRRPTGEVYSEALAEKFPLRDWILTRILWLTGCEPGVNRGGQVDTLQRYIYLHGTPDAEPMGMPLSHGCIRMRNADIVNLFDLVESGMPVIINEST